MANVFARILAGTIDRVVRWVVVPVTGVIPFLVSSGILLVAFAAMWAAFAWALVANPAALDDAWRSLCALPLPVQGVAWLLGLPVTGGLLVWTSAWPLLVRLTLVAALAAWNLLVFVPRRPSQPAVVEP